MNISFNTHRLLLAVLIGTVSVPAMASIEARETCEGNFCWSVAKHRSEQLKDYYVYVLPETLKHLILRYESGAQISVLVRPLPVEKCEASSLDIVFIESNLAKGKGCLVTKRRDQAVQVDYEVAAEDVRQLLHRAAPVVWLSGYTEAGDFLPAASVLFPLDGMGE